MSNMRTLILTASVFAIVVLGLTTAPEGRTDQPDYSKDGRLTAELTFEDVQGGFAGFTGRKIVVQKDGSWTITRVFNQRKFEPHAKGKLTGKQIQSLAETLKKYEVHKLPETIGSSAQANPKVMTLTWGKQKCTCALPAGRDDPANLGKGKLAEVARRMFAIRKSLNEMSTPKEPKDRGQRTAIRDRLEVRGQRRGEAGAWASRRPGRTKSGSVDLSPRGSLHQKFQVRSPFNSLRPLCGLRAFASTAAPNQRTRSRGGDDRQTN